MANAARDDRDPHVGNHFDGSSNGFVVQADSIHGGVYYDQSHTVYQSVHVERPRKGSALVGLVVLGGAGYTAMALPGLFNVVTGQVFVVDGTSGSVTWPGVAPGLAMLGAIYGLILALLTRRGILPRLRRRTLVFTGAGTLILPLAFAIPDAEHAKVSGCFCLVGVAALLVYSWIRNRR
ncbi:hypothetical protein [Kutzneria sp. NPDC052558]|uniref:hypothetical protein n=1 Tax=Kutzneria sp. NPDC052558 TaxID=3364121 RepID=UPI0037CA2CBB